MSFIIAVMYSLDRKYLPRILAFRDDVFFLTCYQTAGVVDFVLVCTSLKHLLLETYLKYMSMKLEVLYH
jgi:hypothetical protein